VPGCLDPGGAVPQRSLTKNKQAAPIAWATPVGSEEPHRILVAEDDEAFLETLAAVLEHDGRFEIVGHARNGDEAVELVRRLDVDAVVMDIEMPHVDGVEATRRLRKLAPDLPIVAISGRDYDERVLEMRDAGASDYVRKARVEDDLASTLISLVRVRS
jgi:DNA-binding NarL/FixJ family response regulator